MKNYKTFYLIRAALFGVAALFIFAGCKPESKITDTNTATDIDSTDSKEWAVYNPNPTNRVQNLDFIFNNQTLGKTTIVIKRSEWNKLCDNYRYFYKNENCVHAESYTYEKDGKSWTMNDVGFRLRGNTSRFCPQGIDNGRKQGQPNVQWSTEYYMYAERPNNDYRQSHFKVDFEEFLSDDDEQKMADCLKGIALKRMDHSCGREIFCYDMFHKYGVWTAPRASHTRLVFNFIEDETDGSTKTIDYGVYEMFEEVNKQSLKARDKDNSPYENAWKNNKGNLWKCAGADLKNTGGMGVENIVINFDDNGERIGKTWDAYSMDLKTNKGDFAKASEEFKGFIEELKNLPDPKNNNDTTAINKIKAFYEKWFDVDLFMRTYAVNILFGMDDDYWGNANNYYLYFDTGSKGSGKVYFIPFDYDNSLGCSISDGGFKQNPLNWGRGKNRPLMDKLLKVPEYKAKFSKLLLQVSAEDSYWNFDDCSKQFLYWKNLVSPYLNSNDLEGHIAVKKWNDYTWQPSGYSLTDKNTNIFDATRESFQNHLR